VTLGEGQIADSAHARQWLGDVSAPHQTILRSHAGWISIWPLQAEPRNLAGIVRVDEEERFDGGAYRLAVALGDNALAAWFASPRKLVLASDALWQALARPTPYTAWNLQGDRVNLGSPLAGPWAEGSRGARLAGQWAAMVVQAERGTPFRLLCRVPTATAANATEELWFKVVRVDGRPLRSAWIVGAAESDSILDQSLATGEYRLISPAQAVRIEAISN